MLLSGVRSSCDMLARNSDLYLEVSASSAAFSSSALAGLLDFLVLPLHFGVLLGELLGFLAQAPRWSAAIPSAVPAAPQPAAETAAAGPRCASWPRWC